MSEQNAKYQANVEYLSDRYNKFNKEIFDCQLWGLSPGFVTIEQRPIRAWGQCEADFNDDRIENIRITMRKWYPSERFCLNILLHEMVHVHEFIKYGKAGHGKTFYAWKPILESHGFLLTRTA